MSHEPTGAVGSSADEPLLADLLLRLEGLRTTDCEARSAVTLIEQDDVLREQLRGRDDLVDELDQRLHALDAVDRFLFRPGQTDTANWPTIPGYEILGELDRGGMGVVYLARQEGLDRKVAIKVLLAGKFASRRLLDRFRREAATVAKLRHPNIVAVFQSGEADGMPFLALEHVRGGSLKQKIAGRPLPAREAAELVEILARAAHYAHQQGIIHRDLKPSNVLLTDQGIPKITDFGLAKALEGDADLTRTGETPGTPAYMAPEQVRGEAIGSWTDVYALGVILYEAMTGRPPFTGGSEVAVLSDVVAKEPIPPGRLEPGMPRDLVAICLKCLEKPPRARYTSAAALAEDLLRFLADEPTQARPQGPLVRLTKWARRRPAAAGLATVSLMAVMALLAGSLWHSRTLGAALTRAEYHRRQAESNEGAAVSRERDVRRRQYAMQMKIASELWEKANAEQLLPLLDHYQEGSRDAELRGFEWHYLWRQGHSELLTYRAHEKPANHVAFSPDDRLLATASDDGTAKLWIAGTDQLVATLRGHTSCVNEVHFSPDGQWIATASCDKTIKLWNATTHEEIATLGPHASPVAGLAISPDGQTIAAGLKEPWPAGQPKPPEVVLWDVETQSVRTVLPDHAGPVHSVTYSPDGTILATAGEDGTVRIWNAKSGEQKRVLSEHGGPVRAVDFSEDGSQLASSSVDGSTITWDVRADWSPHRIADSRFSLSVAFTADGTGVLTGGSRKTIRLWDARTGAPRHTFIGHTDEVRWLTVSQAGNLLASASADGLVKLWRPSDPCTSVIPLEALVDARLVQGDSDLKPMIVGHSGRRFRRWEIHEREVVEVSMPTSMHFRGIKSFALAPTGAALAVQDRSGRLETWDLARCRCIMARSRVRERPVGFTVNGNSVITVAGRTIFLRDTATHELRTRSDEAPGEISRIGVHPDGQALAVAITSGLVARYDIGTSTWQETAFQGQPVSTQAMAFSPDGRLLATTCPHRTVAIWSWERGRLKARLSGHTGDVTSIAFTPDGTTLATGGEESTVRLWRVETGQEMLVFKVLSGAVSDVQFSGDGKRLACWIPKGNGKSEIRVWSVDP